MIESSVRETILIAMGSNVSDRTAHLDHAVQALRKTPRITVRAVSRYHETEPVGGPPQGPFLNAALVGETDLRPGDLLETLLSIEAARGRVRVEPNGPRVLDLDLILYGEQVVEQPGLSVPHPRAHLRTFVLSPAAEVAAEMRHPVLGRTILELSNMLAATTTAVRPPAPAAEE